METLLTILALIGLAMIIAAAVAGACVFADSLAGRIIGDE